MSKSKLTDDEIYHNFKVNSINHSIAYAINYVFRKTTVSTTLLSSWVYNNNLGLGKLDKPLVNKLVKKYLLTQILKNYE